MAYVALYRKYRSQSFGELMGQDHVTHTLQNAIATGRVAHAYLFYGARGCGKTSTARLLARALNCVHQDGPTPQPCGTCRLCTSIRDGSCMDVIEIDAASETSIDDVREKIIENVQYAPVEARYKVYIIDEVHDLSSKAFDALLKTLEEPPKHVIFILATTELQKVPITIRSRCQNFSFKRGSLQDLTAAVQRVIEAEGYTAEPEAVQSIARSAEGSWRDSLSLLEQVLAYSDGNITAATVHRAIGTVGSETLARVTETLAVGRMDATLAMAGELLDSGTDVRQLLAALSGHLRDLMLIAAGANQVAQQELGPDRYARLLPQAALYDAPTLLQMMGILSTSERELRFTNQHRWLLESTLLRLMPCNQREMETVVRPVAARSEPTPIREIVQPPPLAATPTVVPRPHVPDAAAPVALTAEEETEDDDSTEADEEFIASAPVATFATETVVSPAPTPVVEERTPPAVSTPSPSGESRFADAITLQVVQRAWPRILKLFEKASPSGIGFLKKAEVKALDGSIVVLEFADSFSRDRIQNKPKGRELVEKVINDGLNTTGLKMRCELRDSEEGNGGSAIATASAPVAPSDGEATAMSALLDVPITPQNTSSRIMDFDMPAPPPPPAGSNGASASAAKVEIVSPAAAAPPVSNGLLAEALDIFGGEVVRTEPLG